MRVSAFRGDALCTNARQRKGAGGDDMNVHLKSEKGIVYIASETPEVIVRTVQDLLDLVACCGEHDTNLLLVQETNFDPAFYDLKTGLAGEITQKLVNYHVRTVIIGSFESVRSTRFREFMNESNRGTQLMFAENEQAALRWLIQVTIP